MNDKFIIGLLIVIIIAIIIINMMFIPCKQSSLEVKPTITFLDDETINLPTCHWPNDMDSCTIIDKNSNLSTTVSKSIIRLSDGRCYNIISDMLLTDLKKVIKFEDIFIPKMESCSYFFNTTTFPVIGKYLAIISTDKNYLKFKSISASSYYNVDILSDSTVYCNIYTPFLNIKNFINNTYDIEFLTRIEFNIHSNEYAAIIFKLRDETIIDTISFTPSIYNQPPVLINIYTDNYIDNRYGDLQFSVKYDNGFIIKGVNYGDTISTYKNYKDQYPLYTKLNTSFSSKGKYLLLYTLDNRDLVFNYLACYDNNGNELLSKATTTIIPSIDRPVNIAEVISSDGSKEFKLYNDEGNTMIKGSILFTFDKVYDVSVFKISTKRNTLSTNFDFLNIVFAIYEPDELNKVACLTYGKLLNNSDNSTYFNIMTYSNNSIPLLQSVPLNYTRNINISKSIDIRYVRLSRRDGWDLRFCHISFYTIDDIKIDPNIITTYASIINPNSELTSNTVLSNYYTDKVFSLSGIDEYVMNNEYTIVFDLQQVQSIAYILVIAPYPDIVSYYFNNVTVTGIIPNEINDNYGTIVASATITNPYSGIHIIELSPSNSYII